MHNTTKRVVKREWADGTRERGDRVGQPEHEHRPQPSIASTLVESRESEPWFPTSEERDAHDDQHDADRDRDPRGVALDAEGGPADDGAGVCQ